ncbi:MAG: hypothetical protein ACP5N3_06200 [Candidatus Nanoarchaeia archaeon]
MPIQEKSKVLIIGNPDPYKQLINYFQNKQSIVDNLQSIDKSINRLKDKYDVILIHQPFKKMNVHVPDFKEENTPEGVFSYIIDKIRKGRSRNSPVLVTYSSDALNIERYEYLSKLKSLGADEIFDLKSRMDYTSDLLTLIENTTHKEL